MPQHGEARPAASSRERPQGSAGGEQDLASAARADSQPCCVSFDVHADLLCFCSQIAILLHRALGAARASQATEWLQVLCPWHAAHTSPSKCCLTSRSAHTVCHHSSTDSLSDSLAPVQSLIQHLHPCELSAWLQNVWDKLLA